MDSVELDFAPFFRTYKDGRIERLEPPELFVAPSPDPQNGAVCSKDVTIDPNTGLSARLFLPSKHLLSDAGPRKLPLLVYFHGGCFIFGTPFNATYTSYVAKQVLEADVIAVSVRYRRAPEHPIPAAYTDCWAAVQWAVSHGTGSGPDPWLNRFADFTRVFLAGDSAGANIAHHMAIAAGDEDLGRRNPINGLILVHPYFWASSPNELEAQNEKKEFAEKLWPVASPDSMPDPGLDDPRINPLVEGAPSLARLGCRRVLVCVAEKDVFRDRGRLYFEALRRSGWTGVAEIEETEGEEHVFHLMDLESEKARRLVKSLADFIHFEPPVEFHLGFFFV